MERSTLSKTFSKSRPLSLPARERPKDLVLSKKTYSKKGTSKKISGNYKRTSYKKKIYAQKRSSKRFSGKAYKAAIVMNANTGEVIFKDNPRERLLPASLTKMMVTLVAMDKVRQGTLHLNDKVTISEDASGIEGSRINLRPGEVLTLEELLEAVLIRSANDAAVAVAEYVAGSQENFVRLMNAYAQRLGMKDTLFVNVHGLPSENGYDNVSTAYDMAILARELIKYPKVLQWSSKSAVKIRNGRYRITSTNKLLKSFRGLDGLKTGYYRKAGFNLAATAKRNDLRLIAVTLGSPTSKARFNATRTLLDAAFNYYQKKSIESRKSLHKVKLSTSLK
jgi:D-alanyl-D-alanine carboxypeptidase (penicillin-binding protein 5/6)